MTPGSFEKQGVISLSNDTEADKENQFVRNSYEAASTRSIVDRLKALKRVKKSSTRHKKDNKSNVFKCID